MSDFTYEAIGSFEFGGFAVIVTDDWCFLSRQRFEGTQQPRIAIGRIADRSAWEEWRSLVPENQITVTGTFRGCSDSSTLVQAFLTHGALTGAIDD